MWLSPNQMNSLLYWENPRDSGIICGSVLVCLLAVRYISLISVIGNLSLALVTATMSFRIYKSVLAAVNKTNEGHPFKQFLEVDVTLPADKVSSLSDSFFSKLNSILLKLKSILLVENTVESVKVRQMIDFSSSSFIWHFNATGIPKRWSSMKMPLPVALYETYNKYFCLVCCSDVLVNLCRSHDEWTYNCDIGLGWNVLRSPCIQR